MGWAGVMARSYPIFFHPPHPLEPSPVKRWYQSEETHCGAGSLQRHKCPFPFEASQFIHTQSWKQHAYFGRATQAKEVEGKLRCS